MNAMQAEWAGSVSYCTCSQLGDGQEDQRRLKAVLPGTSHGKSRICSLPDGTVHAATLQKNTTSHIAVKSVHPAQMPRSECGEEAAKRNERFAPPLLTGI